jgi:hypothetical protein
MNRSINRFSQAQGFNIITCGWCKVLRQHGVNSIAAMRELGVYPKYWEAKLIAHEQWHLNRGEPLPFDETAAALTSDFIRHVLTPVKPFCKLVVVRPEPTTMEELYGKADKAFQQNGRVDNKPIIRKLDARPWVGMGR